MSDTAKALSVQHVALLLDNFYKDCDLLLQMEKPNLAILKQALKNVCGSMVQLESVKLLVTLQRYNCKKNTIPSFSNDLNFLSF